MSMQTVIFPVKDLAAGKAVFTALLGSEPATDEAYYVGWHVDGQDIGLDPNGHGRGMTGPVCYWTVDDIEKAVASLESEGATVREPVHGVGGTKRIATLVDADGNQIGVMQN
jgi:predicted enzyme related to lactoylglutathione lyase